MDARIEGVRVAETPAGPVAVVTLALDGRGVGADGTPDVDGAPDADGSPTAGSDDGDGAGDGDASAGADSAGGEVLPIFIGFEEAVSIVRGLEAEDIGRPMTHDLLLDVMEELGGRVDRVVVSDVDDGTYVADLHLETPRGSEVIDARPSDSLALASRTNVDIEVDADVFDAGREPVAKYADLDEVREVMEG